MKDFRLQAAADARGAAGAMPDRADVPGAFDEAGAGVGGCDALPLAIAAPCVVKSRNGDAALPSLLVR